MTTGTTTSLSNHTVCVCGLVVRCVNGRDTRDPICLFFLQRQRYIFSHLLTISGSRRQVFSRRGINEPRHVISSHVAFWHVYTWASLCGLPLRLETPSDVRPVAWHSLNIRATRKGSDQTAHMRRLIWDFAGRTYHIDGYLMLQLKCSLQMTLQNIFFLFAITSGFRQIRILYFTALCAYI